PSGFASAPPAGEERSWSRFGLAKVVQPSEPLRPTTDDWPFLYLRAPMVPDLTLRGVLLMGGLALVLLFVLRPRGEAAGGPPSSPGMGARLFFLGAGFLLGESKAGGPAPLPFGTTRPRHSRC